MIFYGCPGEEGGAGKAYMAREGLWKELDAALCWHPGDANQTMTGTNNSCIQVLYKFSGVPAHAAGDPFNGRSALDAVELMNVGVQFLREHMTEDCRIHYAITDTGGVSPNVVQAKASVLYMVRANKVADSVKLQARVDDIAKGAALMTGTSFERMFIDGTAETLPNFTLEKALYANMEASACPTYTARRTMALAALRDLSPQRPRYGIAARADDDDPRAGRGALRERHQAPQRLSAAALLRHGLHPRQHRRGGCELADPHRPDPDGVLARRGPRPFLADRGLRQEQHCPQGHALAGRCWPAPPSTC